MKKRKLFKVLNFYRIICIFQDVPKASSWTQVAKRKLSDNENFEERSLPSWMQERQERSHSSKVETRLRPVFLDATTRSNVNINQNADDIFKKPAPKKARLEMKQQNRSVNKPNPPKTKDPSINDEVN